jgi:hypothetical protein
VVVTVHSATNANRGIVPQRYRNCGFWLIRFFLAMVAGGLALASAVETPFIAFSIGVTTPRMIIALLRSKQNEKE